MTELESSLANRRPPHYSSAEVNENLTQPRHIFENGTTQKFLPKSCIYPYYAARRCDGKNAARGMITVSAEEFE
jgi:hypothetical protein